MSQFTAPDGSVYNIPTEPNKRRLFTKAIKDTYGVDVDKTTVLQRAAEIPKGIARGATLLATDVPLGISALFDVGDDGAITKGLQDFQKRVRETSPLAAKPGYEDLWTTKLAEGVGSFVPFLGAAKVGQVLTKTPQKLFTKEYFKSPAFTVPGALGVTSGMAQQADRIEMARQLGEDVGPVAETLATVTGGTIGVSEVLPVAAILNKLSKGALLDEVMGNKIKRALVSGTQEGAQEVFASIAQDATARGFYSDELPIGESILDEFTIGATIGAGADLILNSFAGRRGLANQRFKDEEQAARENNRIAQENKKAEFELAQQQGDLEVLQPRVSKETPDVPVPPITTTVPTLSVIQTPDGKYSLIDPTNTTQPVLRVFDTEAKALTSKKREQNKLFREKNLSELTNDLYNLGLINSSSGLAMGNTIKDTNNQFVNAKSIIDFDSKVDPKKLKSKDDYFKNKNVDVKDVYTFAEVRKILNAKDLNLLLRDKASQVFAASEKAGEPSIRDDKKLVNVNNKAIKDLAASKNIELDFTDPAVRYFSRQLTGFDDIAKVKNRGAKELFVARLHSLPKFNVKTKFPDFRPRNYTAQDMADFVANYKTDNIKFDVGSLLKAGPDPIRKNKVATEQFVRDLVNSGRAEKIEGTNNYQIRDNFEFDIARRAEGFNETPEEFGARLKSEGVLPDETITQLQEAEQVRQERFLPPEEVAPKMINFAEAVEEGKVNKFAKEAQKVLDGVGLGEVGLVISDDILSTTALRRRDDTFAFDPEGVTPGTKRVRGEVAEYDRNTDTIFISLSAINPDGTLSEVEIQQRINRVINHELIHALRAKDLITEKDYTYLAKEVKRRKVPASVDPSAAERGITYYTRAAESYSNLVDRATPEQREDLFVEEAIAELYKNKDSKPDVPTKAKTILGKITQFFESLGQAFKRSGFNRASEILQEIEAGKVGARERGVLRSVKDVFRPERAGIPTFSRDADDAYFANERKKRRLSNLKEQLVFREAELNEVGSQMTDNTRTNLEKQISNIKDRITEIESDIPTFSKGARYEPDNKGLADATEKAEEYAKSTRKFQVPTYNTNASDVALKAAIEFNEDATPKKPDIPTFSVGEMPQELQASARRVMGAYDAPTEPYGVRLIDLVSDPITNVRKLFKNARQLYIDKYDKIARKSIQLSEDNDAIRLLNNTADTSAIAAIRMSDRARGIFQGLLTTGYATDLVDGETGLINVLPLELSAEYNTFLQPETQDTQDVSGRVVKEAGKYYGGLTQILAPVYTNSSVDGEQIFKLYGILKRAKKIDETTGKETPVTADDLAKIPYIESNFPEIVEAYNNYQRWNNQLIELAKNKGLLSEAQATQWQDYSAYYPFYRNMVEDGSILGPSIGGGALPTNPLGVKMKGSVEAIDTNPVEAIARNSLSILNAAMKNDGMQKLMRDLQLNGEAELVDVTQASRPDVVPVFVDGEKVYYRVDDLELVESMQGMGVTSLSGLSKFLAMPASFLRDVVTRDPGFVVVNLLRDTLSASVTSGVPINSEEGGFKPVITTVRNMFRDMTDLERFGVLGGYDFQNDEGSVKQFVDRAIRKEGINPDNSMSMSNLFYKAWDGLGALTTKSDGATRLGVFDAVYKDIKERGGTEAQAQSEAAYQGLEIINFGRRGSDPLFRTITAAIPFLNARIQGLDVLYRSFGTGEYSAIQKLEAASPEAAAKLKQDIFYTAMSRGMFITFLTLLYYLMVSDDEEYQNIRREVRDDNWIIPLGNDIPAVKIPIPFEVGMVFKAIPERTFDLAMGETSLSEYSKSLRRQLGTSANIPFFDGSVAFQVIKPIADVVANRNSFTGTDIVPYYQTKLEPAYQQRATTNELARVIGETFNISPIKLEYIVRGYTGTLGGYLLDAADSVTRLGTGTPYIPPNINSVPVVKRFLLDLDKGGGLQQQFYDLRNEVDRAVQTMNKLKKSGRFDELQAYRTNMQGVLNVKGQIRAIEKYMDNWRKRRDVLLARTDINPLVKAELLEQLEMERDKRLSIITELKKKANVPAYQMGL